MPLILLVDNEEETLTLYSQKLRQSGFEVVTARTGAEALAAAEEKHPDLILLDVKMPDMDGVQVFEKLKAEAKTRGIKVAFFSGFGDPVATETDVVIAQGMGAAGFLKKGISLDELVTKVKEYLKGAK